MSERWDEWRCKYCGTVWRYQTKGDRIEMGGMSGFIVSRIRTHEYHCEVKTDEERVRWIRSTRRRQAKRPALWSYMVFPTGGENE